MVNARERILDAAADVLRERGVAATTTKQIAQTAGYSEALLYKHFHDKEEILLHVLRERMPGYTAGVVPGAETVEANLILVAHGALRFYLRAFPMMAPMVAQPRLMNAARESLARYGGGPEHPIRALADYLAAEQALGRVSPGADPETAAALLMGACFQQAFLRYFRQGQDFARSTAVDLVHTFLPTLHAA